MPRGALRPISLRRHSGVMACRLTFMGESILSIASSTSASVMFVRVTKLPCKKLSR